LSCIQNRASLFQLVFSFHPLEMTPWWQFRHLCLLFDAFLSIGLSTIIACTCHQKCLGWALPFLYSSSCLQWVCQKNCMMFINGILFCLDLLIGYALQNIACTPVRYIHFNSQLVAYHHSSIVETGSTLVISCCSSYTLPSFGSSQYADPLHCGCTWVAGCNAQAPNCLFSFACSRISQSYRLYLPGQLNT